MEPSSTPYSLEQFRKDQMKRGTEVRKRQMGIIKASSGNLTKSDIDKFLGWSNSFQRFHDFIFLSSFLRDELYWYALGYAYSDSDDLYSIRKKVKNAFARKDKGKEALMTIRELRLIKNFPEEFEIFRGMTQKEFDSEKFGVSWTASKKVAEFFANKYCRNISTDGLPKVVVSATVCKEDVIALFIDRQEREIITLNPCCVRIETD